MGRYCIGFPKGTPCNNIAEHPKREPLWCNDCEQKRRDHITAQLDKMLDALNNQKEVKP